MCTFTELIQKMSPLHYILTQLQDYERFFRDNAFVKSAVPRRHHQGMIVVNNHFARNATLVLARQRERKMWKFVVCRVELYLTQSNATMNTNNTFAIGNGLALSATSCSLDLGMHKLIISAGNITVSLARTSLAIDTSVT